MELRGWKKTELHQIYKNSCVATGYSWLLKFNNLDSFVKGISDFQKKYNLEKKNCFATVHSAIRKDLHKTGTDINTAYENMRIKSYPLTKDGWSERLEQIKKLLKNNTGCIMPVPVKGLGWHIMPVIKLEEDYIWLLRENYAGIISLDVLELNVLRRYFLNEEGGEDLAWIEKTVPVKKLIAKTVPKKKSTSGNMNFSQVASL